MIYKLQSCPYCGGKAELNCFQEGNNPLTATYNVECSDCDSETREYSTREDAIAAWNNGDIY